EGRLTMQRCMQCGHLQFYPRRYCTRCLCDRLSWETISGDGEVYSYSTVYRALSPAFKDQVPYIVASVELREGPRMMTRLIECSPADVHVGMPVEVTFMRETEKTAPTLAADAAALPSEGVQFAPGG